MFGRVSSSLIALLLSVPLVLATTANIAHADEQLRMTSTTTYTVDAVTGVVHVEVDMLLRNMLGCDYYYTSFYLPVPIGSSPATGTSRGRSVRIVTQPIEGNESYILLDIRFVDRLFCKEEDRVVVTYDLLGSAPRTENPSRINPAYASFLAFGFGDDVSIEVVVPPNYTSETFGQPISTRQENGNTVYFAEHVEDPNEFDVFVSASNNSALVESDVTTDDGVVFRVQAWPGDTEWQEFITEQIENGVPLLVELIGQPWPIDEPVDVRESHTPYLYGYAGWFSISTNDLEVGEDLDIDTALHELSHAWFSDLWFSERWLVEGFAQVYASKGVEELGGTPLKPRAIFTDVVSAVLLNEWGEPSFSPDEDSAAREEWGYNASFYIVLQIAEELGDDNMRAVLNAVANDLTAYPGDGTPEKSATTTDWRRFLDLVEQIGGSAETAELLEKYVLTSSDISSLDDRTAARAKYHELLEHGGEWAAPVVVRNRMAAWNFERATELMLAAEEVLELRAQLDARANDLETAYPVNDLERLYEDSDDTLDEAKAATQEYIHTADALLAAIARDAEGDGFFGSIGLIGADLAGPLAEAKEAFAAGDHARARDLALGVIDQIDDAVGAGQIRVFIVGGALAVAVLATVVIIRRRRKRAAGGDSKPGEGEGVTLAEA